MKNPVPRTPSRLSNARLAEMIEEATVDAYGESEQATGWFTMIEQNLALPFETQVLGTTVTVTKIGLGNDDRISAICTRGRERQAISIVDLPLPLQFEELFRHHAIATLTADGFQASEIERLLSTHGHRFAKTNSRPVTGSMNDHIQNSRCYIEQDGGLKVADVGAINHRMNRTPMGALAPGQDMDFPIEVLTRIIRPWGAA